MLKQITIFHGLPHELVKNEQEKKKGKIKRNVKLKNRKRFNVLFIFLGFFNDNNTRICSYLEILEIQKIILHLKN